MKLSPFLTPLFLPLWILALFTLLPAASVLAAAPDWSWTGQASPDQNWYGRKDTGTRDPDNNPIYVNNWGQYGTGWPLAPGGGNVSIGAPFTAWIDHDQSPIIDGMLLGSGTTLHLYNGGRLTVQGPALLLDGELRIHYGGYAGPGYLTIGNTTTMAGRGSILFQDAAVIDGSATVTTAGDLLLHGYGATIHAPLNNQGTLHADTLNGWIDLQGSVPCF
jgi:hypothetical protein